MSKHTIIVGDVHGNVDALINTLMAAGAINRDGTKNNDWKIVQVGDLCNMAPYGVPYRGMYSEDLDVLEWSLEIIDVQLVGNHELFFTHGMIGGMDYGISMWRGMARDDELQPRLAALIKRLTQYEGRFLAAAEVDGMLVTHAGLHRHLAERAPLSSNAADVAQDLNNALIALSTHEIRSYPPITDPSKGIFWNRPQPHGYWSYGQGMPFIQVCGHTPLQEEHPKFYKEINTWIIDSGNYSPPFRRHKDSDEKYQARMDAWIPSVGAIVKRDGEDEYTKLEIPGVD